MNINLNTFEFTKRLSELDGMNTSTTIDMWWPLFGN
jgi:hypothetical protein